MTDTLLRRSTPGWLLTRRAGGRDDHATSSTSTSPPAATCSACRSSGTLTDVVRLCGSKRSIDRTEFPPRVVSRRDLAPLGPGYRPEWLVPAGTGGTATGIQ